MRQSAAEKSLDIQFLQADLKSLASVLQVAKRFNEKESNLDILINNAGVSPILSIKDTHQLVKDTCFQGHGANLPALLPTPDYGGTLWADRRWLRDTMADQLSLALPTDQVTPPDHDIHSSKECSRSNRQRS